MIRSKLTSKAQTTIPAPVRTVLGPKAGDKLVYSVQGFLFRTPIDRFASDDLLWLSLAAIYKPHTASCGWR